MDENRHPWAEKPIVWAFSFAVFDLLWLLGLHAVAWSRATDKVVSVGTWWSITDSAMKLWNTLHVPVRRLIEPILFPVVTSHPLSPSDSVFLVFETLCVLQSVIVGYAVGVMIRWAMQPKR